MTSTFVHHYGGAMDSKHLKVSHHRPTRETPFEWRFAGVPMVPRHCVLVGHAVACCKLYYSSAQNNCKTIV